MPGALDLVAVERLQHDLDVVRADLVLLAVDVDAGAAAVAQPRRVERRDRGGHLRHVLAEARAERAVVGLDLEAPQLVGLRDVADRLHVQLVGEQRLEALDRLALAVGRHHDRLAQRLAHLQLGVRPGGAAQLDRVAHHLHVPLELLVARARLREVAQVHRGLAAVEVLVDRVGNERGQRREQLGDRDQAVVQHRERGRVAVPEAPPREAHVPVREVVDELRDGAPGERRVVVLHALDHALGGGRQARLDPAVELRRRSPASPTSSIPFTFAYRT